MANAFAGFVNSLIRWFQTNGTVFCKPDPENTPEIVTVDNLLQLFHSNSFELTPTSDKIVSYTDAERQTAHVKVPVPLPLPDNIQSTIAINPKIQNAVDLGQALIVGVVNEFHSLCLVIIYETDRYMCYSFGVGGHDNKHGFSIYQPDFTLVGLNSFDQAQDQNMIKMAQNIRKSRIVDIQAFTPELLQKYYELFFNIRNTYKHFTDNFMRDPNMNSEDRLTAINCAFALLYFLDIKTSIIGINGTLDQGLGSVAQIPMNKEKLLIHLTTFCKKRPETVSAVSDAAAVSPADKRLKSNRGGTRQRKTNNRKERRTMKKRKGRKTKKKRRSK